MRIDLDTIIDSDGLYKTMVPGAPSFVWRVLTLKEYRAFRKLMYSGAYHPYNIYSAVFERCYIGDAAFIDGNLPAGIFISIGEMIMWMSGDCASHTQKNDILAARAHYPSDSVHEVMKRVILLAFPTYTLEDIDSWTRPELLYKFSVAESVLVNRGIGYEPIDVRKIMSADQVQEKKNKIDFAKENKELGDTKGIRGDHDHILDASPDEFARKQKIARIAQQRKNLATRG
jgi:hypothetical protein